MARRIAQCRLRIKPAALVQRAQASPEKDPVVTRPDDINDATSKPESPILLKFSNHSQIPKEIRLKWATAIIEEFSGPSKAGSGVREFDFILKADGSVENRAATNSAEISSTLKETHLKEYTARYQIPRQVLDHIQDDKEKIKRTELFALGCIVYELVSGKILFPNVKDEEKDGDEIEKAYVEGWFPDDVWGLEFDVRILGFWCPGFEKDFGKKASEPLKAKVRNYIKDHPIIFGLQVVGGTVLIASGAALPILSAVGFGGAGPLAGSIAAGWQSSIGLVQAGSFFAWCQSAAMGGAAVNGIVATGVAGAGLTAGATAAGATSSTTQEMKRIFLEAWKRDVEGAVEEKKDS